MPAETPIFVVFGDCEWAPKKDHFPKQIVATKMRAFVYLPNKNTVCQFFEEYHLNNKKTFLQNHQKTFFFQIFCWKLSFSIFSLFLFSFLQHKNIKYIFLFENPVFDTPTTCKQNKITSLHTICDLIKVQKNTIKMVKTSKTDLGPSFDATLGQVLT